MDEITSYLTKFTPKGINSKDFDYFLTKIKERYEVDNSIINMNTGLLIEAYSNIIMNKKNRNPTAKNFSIFRYEKFIEKYILKN